MHTKLRIAVLTGLASTALAGCGDSNVTMQPGRYETKATITEINLPGAPPQVAEMMKAAAQQTQTACLTPDDVTDPSRKLAPRQNPGSACSENTFEWKGGDINGKLRCNLPQGEVKADMTGSYTADSFNMEVKTDMAVPGKANERGTINLRAEGRRVGDCDGTEKTK